MNEDEQFRILLNRIRAGDTDAVKQFWEQYGPMAHHTAIRFAARYANRKIDADDIASQVLLRLHGLLTDEGSRLPEFPDQEAFRQWLSAVCAHTARRTYLTEARRERATTSQNIEQVLDDDANETASDAREQISWALRQLPNRERHVIEARLSEVPFSAIASQLGMTEANVRQLHMRAVRKLRAIIDESSRPKPVIKDASATEKTQAPRQSVPMQETVEQTQSEVANSVPFVTPRSEVDPLIEVYFAGDNLSAKEIRLFLDYLAARYRELGGTGLTVVEGQTLVPDAVGVTT